MFGRQVRLAYRTRRALSSMGMRRWTGRHAAQRSAAEEWLSAGATLARRRGRAWVAVCTVATVLVATVPLLSRNETSAATLAADTFGSPAMWQDWMCNAQEQCALADVNGDGKADAVSFVRSTNAAYEGDVYVALSTGTEFERAVRWQDWMCNAQEQCALADVNADNKADAVAFVKSTNPAHEGDVYVALSTGTGFERAVRWQDWMCNAQEQCALADVNGDGRADAVAFVKSTNPAHEGDVYVAVSTGSEFWPAVRWSDWMCNAQEQCALADVNGDYRADAVAFVKSTNPTYEGDVYVAVSTGSEFERAVRWSELICVANEECALDDINGDRSADVVAFVKSTQPGVHEGDVWAVVAARRPVAASRTAAPRLDPVQVSGTTVTLRWTDRSSTEDTFEVVRRDPTGPLTTIASVPSTSRAGTGQTYTFTDTVAAGTRRCYEIAAHRYHRTGINYSYDMCTAPPDPVTPPAALPWGSITSLDTAAHSGIFSSVAVGTDGLALISYYRGGAGNVDDLMVAHCVDAACTAVTTTTIDSAGNVGWASSIKIGRDGLGLISYRDNTNEDLKVAHCINVACTSATVSTLDTGRISEGTSLTIGGDGLGLIAYKDRSVGETVKVAHCLNAACSTARVTIVDTIHPHNGEPADRASITTGAGGFGLIAYVEGSGFGQRVAACTNADCSLAITSTVDNRSGLYHSITVGRDGLGLISHSGGGGLTVAHCDNVYCTTVTNMSVAGSVSDTSITIGGDGLGIVSYHDPFQSKDLKVAHCSDLACTTVTITTVDAFDDVGGHTSITKGGDGRPLVSYYDQTNGDLKVARCPDIRCTGEFVTPF